MDKNSQLKRAVSRVLLLSFMLIPFNIFAQNISTQQKDELLPSIKQLLLEYEKYSQFSTDGETLSPDYMSKYSLLFDANIVGGIYNDINPSGKGMLSKPNDYIDFVKSFYPFGLDVDIDADNVQIVDASQSKGQFNVVIKVKKKITGMYKNEKLHRFNDEQYMTLVASAGEGGKASNFRINGVLSKDKYAQTILNKREKGLYVGLSGALSSTPLFSDEAKSSSSMSVKAGKSFNPYIDVNLMLNKWFGIGIGLRYSSYNSTFTINDYSKTTPFIKITDMDGDVYNPVLDISKIVQDHKIKSIDIPLLFKFRAGKGKIKPYLDLGVVYSKIMSSTFTLKGNATRSGYYESLNVTLTDIPEYGFGTYTYNADKDYDFKVNTAFSAYASVGLLYQFAQDFAFRVGYSFLKEITELSSEKDNIDNYASLVLVEPLKNLRYNSIEIGVVYKIPLKH